MSDQPVPAVGKNRLSLAFGVSSSTAWDAAGPLAALLSFCRLRKASERPILPFMVVSLRECSRLRGGERLEAEIPGLTSKLESAMRDGLPKRAH